MKKQKLINTQYTCVGKDISPPINLANLKKTKDTQSFALLCCDSTNPWIHWLIQYINPSIKKIPKGDKKKWWSKHIKENVKEGYNTWKTIGYKGPCPPRGDGAHKYHFYTYSLSINLSNELPLTIDKFIKKIKNNIIDKKELVLWYERFNKPSPGDRVIINIKPYNNNFHEGIVKKVLTSKKDHPRGHKVMLTNGLIGRIVKIK